LRWRLPVAGLIGAVLIAMVTRIALALRSPDAVFDSLAEVVRVFSVGLVFDLGTAAFLVLPLVLYAWLAPRRLGHRLYRAGAIALLFPFLWGLSFVALAEFLFWDEFSARFNFIAVDYLIYTREVAGNIWQSYPVVPLLAGVTVIAALACAGLARFALRTGPAAPSLFRRARWALPLIAAPVIVYAALDSRNHEISGNVALNQLAGNGVFEFFAAIRNNELNYTAFYATRPLAEAFAELKQELAGPGIRFTSDAPFAFEHEVTAAGPEKHLNVVLVSVESLSAEFLGAYGDTHGLTPNLDRLTRESLVFTRTYATGTRTVRGLEALSLSIPPTPGISIVRRPNNEGLFSLGHLLGSRGYDSMYVYGGYGYFDNMNAFFGANGYKVVDRRALKSEDIHHETIWGVADEDLFTLALREVDASHAAGKPFFAHVMTTSNHRPYTYPAGRIDIPSGTGREGAVKYTDWAIGRFLEEARSRPWFDDTVFVIVADHCAAAGPLSHPAHRLLAAARATGPLRLHRVADRRAADHRGAAQPVLPLQVLRAGRAAHGAQARARVHRQLPDARLSRGRAAGRAAAAAPGARARRRRFSRPRSGVRRQAGRGGREPVRGREPGLPAGLAARRRDATPGGARRQLARPFTWEKSAGRSRRAARPGPSSADRRRGPSSAGRTFRPDPCGP
jgi:phosphoglycerol transferase MdoB-like AlkP superfamily enzyme